MEVAEVRRLTPEMRREQTRTLLIEAAAAVFAARGYANASLAEIAETAGFTTGAVYSNFGSKEDLFLAVTNERREAMYEQFFALDETADEATRIKAVYEVYQRLTPTTAQWVLWEEFLLYALRNPEAREKLEADTEAAVRVLVDLVRKHQRSIGGEPALPAEALARLYMALFEGLARQRAVQPHAVPDNLFATLVAFIDDAVAAPGKQKRRRR